MNKFDKEAKNWDKKDKRVKNALKIANRIKKQIEIKKDSYMLDYGCGSGLLTLAFIDDVRKIAGFDSSAGMLEVLNEKIKEQNLQNIKTKQHNIETDSFKQNKYDLVTSAMLLHHIKKPKSFIAKVYSALKDGGYLAIADLVKEDGSFHSNSDGIYHFGFEKSYIVDILRDNGFRNIEFSIVNKIEKNGKKYPVFLVTAKK